ncbi:methanol oxidation system protein MoxJ [Phyllobacterium phragmitis]|uniref:Methanol oxidation system protein MoxJ n=1 Tax=Phyllobacterium phragmitis TaxID=2670329 RepID=A0A2S9IL75_9HYPH|nr:methanol oxidation system protein MoxJ [Phyllobacterium phragmitis]PRD41277.1 methanol oxidation system protein MoxJ [Phyllobacterium phragmitis]
MNSIERDRTTVSSTTSGQFGLGPLIGAASTAICVALSTGIALAAGAAEGTEAAELRAPDGVLRICASTKGAPYTMKDGSGFENRVAVVIADAMGRKPELVWTDKPSIFLVRDFLDKGACDVVMGLDDGDPRVLTSKPYYRTGYVFITRTDRGLEIDNWSDEDLRKVKTIGYQFHSPAEVMLKQTGLYEDNLIYQYSLVNFTDRRNQFTQVSGERLVSEVANGTADAAVAFAPDVARYVKNSSTPLTMKVIDQNGLTASGELIPQQFDQSIAVRQGDTDLREEIDAALLKVRPQIEAILEEEGIPLLQPNT